MKNTAKKTTRRTPVNYQGFLAIKRTESWWEIPYACAGRCYGVTVWWSSVSGDWLVSCGAAVEGAKDFEDGMRKALNWRGVHAYTFPESKDALRCILYNYR